MVEVELIIRRVVYLILFMCAALPGVMLLFLISEKRLRVSEGLRAVQGLSPKEKCAFAVVSTLAAVFGTFWALSDIIFGLFGSEDVWSWRSYVFLALTRLCAHSAPACGQGYW